MQELYILSVLIMFKFNIQIACGPDNLIYYASVMWPGSVHDARVFRESYLCCKMENGNYLVDIQGKAMP